MWSKHSLVLFYNFKVGSNIAGKVNSVQEACKNDLRFTYQNLKSRKPHEKKKKKHQNAKAISGKLKTKCLMFFVSFFFTDYERPERNLPCMAENSNPIPNF